MPTTRNRPVTADDVGRICGQLEDSQIARILAARPTIAELIAAHQWMSNDDTPGLHETRSPKVQRLCEILETPQLDEE